MGGRVGSAVGGRVMVTVGVLVGVAVDVLVETGVGVTVMTVGVASATVEGAGRSDKSEPIKTNATSKRAARAITIIRLRRWDMSGQ